MINQNDKIEMPSVMIVSGILPIDTFTGYATFLQAYITIGDGSSTNAAYVGHTITCRTAGVLGAGMTITSVRTAGVNGAYNISANASASGSSVIFDIW